MVIKKMMVIVLNLILTIITVVSFPDHKLNSENIKESFNKGQNMDRCELDKYLKTKLPKI